MSEKYFAKFPTITYSNTTCLDLTRRVTISDELRKSPSVYYKYAIKTGARPDLIADNYYQDPYYDWLLFLNNGIIDPYYDWYLNDFDFNEFITTKYGSLEEAQKRISHYELNYLSDEVDITLDFYNNHLPYVLKKYYTPIYSANDKILSYQRKTESTITNTNRLVQLGFVNTLTFTEGDIVDILNSSASDIVGGGEVTYSKDGVIIIKNISGDLSVGNKVRHDNATSYANITTSTILHENLSDEEFVYWKAKSFYDVEFEINEANRDIRILHSQYAEATAETLRKLLK